MITVGAKVPEFVLPAVRGGPLEEVASEPFLELAHDSHPGRWLVLFYYPMDFTFVCPTELAAFGAAVDDFAEREAVLLGASTDTHFVHLAWRNAQPELRDLPYALLADYKRALAGALGIIHPEEGVALRATFLVDPGGVVRWVNVNDLNVGRNVDEVLRVLDALQTDELCPCNWTPGQPTLEVRADG
ncbi:MAG: peroxiredoxin [Planctomycetota bacterium]